MFLRHQRHHFLKKPLRQQQKNRHHRLLLRHLFLRRHQQNLDLLLRFRQFRCRHLYQNLHHQSHHYFQLNDYWQCLG
jgi:hypothetical protein